MSTLIAAAEWRAVIDDWYVDGTFDESHRCVAVREAVERLGTARPKYSSIYADLRRLEHRACGP